MPTVAGRSIVLALTLLVVIAVPHSAVGAAGARSDLTGHVTSADGRPLDGATVYVWTAGPKVGTSSFCPSCYADCGKHARSAASDGAFSIPQLDGELIFRLLVLREGFTARFVEKVDPAAGAPIEVALTPAPPPPADPKCTLIGTVEGPDGKGVAGATVTPIGMHTADGLGSWGAMDRFMDPVAVTNDAGQFQIVSQKAVESLDVQVEARGLAKLFAPGLSTGPAPQRLRLIYGAGVTVRVLKDGKPLPGVEVGMAQVDRSESFVGEYTLGTDESGRATFANIPIGHPCFVYGKMQSLAGLGAVAVKQIEVGGADLERHDAGDLIVEPGLTLSGRVVLADGKPVPAKTRLLISREQAWDVMNVELDDQGRFTVTNLPAEDRYSLSVRIRGYHTALKNLSIDQLNGGSLRGDIRQDIRDLQFLLEPGPFERPDMSEFLSGRIKQPTGPLRGAN